MSRETIDSEVQGGEETREEVLLAAVTPLLPLPPSPSTVYRLVRRRNKQKPARRRRYSLLPFSSSSPPPPSLSAHLHPALLFHGEELSRCRLRGSRGWDGMELRQIGQSKVSLGAQEHAPPDAPVSWKWGCNNGTALPEPLHSAGAAGCCLTVTTFPHRHGVRWKVNSGMETVRCVCVWGGGPGGWVDGS